MRIVDDITKFIFLKDRPQKVDIIYIPGDSYAEIAEEAARLWHLEYSGMFMELYNCPRFTTPDTNGDIILDYYIPVDAY